MQFRSYLNTQYSSNLVFAEIGIFVQLFRRLLILEKE